jgi:hypothetical protein
MKFAKIVFYVAGIFGILDVVPVYFLRDYIGRHNPPAITHPEFYYGFVGVALTWQLVFLVIAKNPGRYRALIIPSVLEKASYVFANVALLATHNMTLAAAVPSVSDLILGLLFLAAYFKTRPTSEAL